MNRLPWVTIGVGIYIVISASFMLQVRSFFVQIFGNEIVKAAVLVLFFLTIGFYTLYLAYRRIPLYRIGFSFFVFVLAYLLMLSQAFSAEKFHVIEYGILGYLALKDLFWKGKQDFKNVIYALGVVILFGLLDEAFQWVLPYRVFEIKDIAINTISGFLGITQYLVYRSYRF